jgi:hypothetical protein
MGIRIMATLTVVAAALGEYYIPEAGTIHYTFFYNTGYS